MVKSSSVQRKIGSTADPKQVNPLQQRRPQQKHYVTAGKAEQRSAGADRMPSAQKDSVNDRDACIFKLQTENDSLRRRIKQVEHERDLRARNYEGLAKHSAYYQHYLAQLATTSKFANNCSSGDLFEKPLPGLELGVSNDLSGLEPSLACLDGRRTSPGVDCSYRDSGEEFPTESILDNHVDLLSPSSIAGEPVDQVWNGKLSSSNSPVLLNTCEMYRPPREPSPMSISDGAPDSLESDGMKLPNNLPKTSAKYPGSGHVRSKQWTALKMTERLIIPCASDARQHRDAEIVSLGTSQNDRFRATSSESKDSSSDSDSDDSDSLERRSSDTSESLRSGTNASSVQSRSDSEELQRARKQESLRTGSIQSPCSSPTIQAVAARLNQVDVSSSRRNSACSALQTVQREFEATSERKASDISSFSSISGHFARRADSKSPAGSAKLARKSSVQSSSPKRGRQPVHRDEETDSDLKAAIRESYTNFKLNGKRLKFTYEPQPLDPNAINLNTNWKWRSKLNEATVKKLLTAGGEISAFLPESDDKKAVKREVDLIKRLCKCGSAKYSYSSLREIVDTLRREREVTRDELNLVEFELYSTLIVMKHQNEHEFTDTVKHFSDYQGDLLGMYYSLNMFLSHLDPSWDGLQLLVLVYLLRAGVGRLLKYLVATTRPAAIELLLKRFGESKVMAKRRQMIGSLVELSGETCASRLRQVTPLKRLQDRIASVTASSVVSAALGYNDPHHIPRESYAGEEFHNLEAQLRMNLALSCPTHALKLPRIETFIGCLRMRSL